MEINYELLRVPLTPEMAAGEDLRYEGTYDRIQQARREDDPNLPQGIWQTELKRADWVEAERLCREALESRTRDLQIAAWLLESWIALHGFAGIAPGLEVVGSLCREFWTELYPPLDPEDPDFRMAPLEWINEKLSLRVRQLPLTPGGGAGTVTYSFVDWEAAWWQKSHDRKKRETGTRASVETIQAALAAAPDAFAASTMRSIVAARAALEALEATLQERCGRDAPSVGRMRETLAAISALLEQVWSSRGASFTTNGALADSSSTGGFSIGEPAYAAGSPEPIASMTTFDVSPTPEPATSPRADGAISSRAEAYRMLEAAADYLMRAEPHSPAPWLVRRAIAWGGMPLPMLLHELVKSGGSLSGMYQLLGMEPPAEIPGTPDEYDE